MNQALRLLHLIPFFSDKNFTVSPGIYHNDTYPACLLVHWGTESYKVRFPGILNQNSVQSEKDALKLLAKYNVSGIPQVITDGIVGDIPYIIEYYINGNSLDKIHNTLSHEDWEYIAHKIAFFLQELAIIQSEQSYVFKKPEIKYENYGEIIKESTYKHLYNHVSSGIMSRSMADCIQKIMEDISLVFDTKASFLHFDIKPQNIVFDSKSKEVSFIDYEHSRIGDFTHELFRADMAAIRNPYFAKCWELAKQEFLSEHFNPFKEVNYPHKLFYYELFHDISEMTYSVLINDQGQISNHLNNIMNKL